MFDRVGHHILQAPRVFGVPDIIIMAIQQHKLVGFAYVELIAKRESLLPSKQVVDKVTQFPASVPHFCRAPQQAPSNYISGADVRFSKRKASRSSSLCR
jgi:hypothetical protein